MKFDFPIKLGSMVRDETTKVEGILIAATKEINGNWRGDIQPQTTDNKFIDAISTDAVNIEIINDGLSSKVSDTMPDTKFELEQEVEDKHNEAKGIVHRISWHMNGCIIYRIKSKSEDKLSGGPKYTQAFENDIKAIAPPPTKDETPPTGGPVERLSRGD